ncbi:MAG: YhbY family RNA-binding protein [Nanoarchaeota archaeon]
MQTEIQIGKKGLTLGFLDLLKSAFKTHELVRIKVLKSAGHEKKKVKEISEEILNQMGKNYTCRTIGFTLIIRKWRKARR